MSEAFYIYGRRSIVEALRQAARVQKLYVLYGSAADIQERARRSGVPVSELSRQRFTELAQAAGTTLKESQGVIALVYPLPVLSAEELLERAAPTAEGLLVAVDGVEDPQNLGAIARCAEAAGAQGLIVPRHRAAPLTPAAVKAAAGAFMHLPVAHVVNLGDVLRRLQRLGWWIVGSAVEGERLYWEPLYDRPVVLVVGSEHRGMRPSIRALCDLIVRIPLRGRVESLNAAAAAAVLLFEIQRQRYQIGLWSESLKLADVPN
ncbi:MAG: 23S rRNA (guanosine(2251)-2'-O)-methyltransferase RlmB [Candidatus Kapabacteria bacterium]|nr:23S rRNA (guanosine(2251)-2'-O)-methyltransferase RlmB [Candidatus Kapabacteria bacterium]MDW8012146.1 23S rRNA (guanosine(2251)-2'-O)-methyltransferase RlmB [Bacteroidota bacterium]